MLARAQDLMQHETVANRVKLTCGDAEKLPYGDESVDGIFMCFVLELFDTPEIPRVLTECRRVLRRDGRIVVVAVSKEGKPGLVLRAFEWTHRHFPNLLDCRPIYVRRALEAAGFIIDEFRTESMWVSGIGKEREDLLLRQKKGHRGSQGMQHGRFTHSAAKS